MKSEFSNYLDQGLKDNKLTLSSDLKQKIILFLSLMQEWNRVFNLTSIVKPREMVYLHIIDSLIVKPYLKGSRFLDVGSGAGLPGIPLAIANPHQTWVLLDKNNKKTRFLTQVAALLDLANVNVVKERVEDYHPHERFDGILSRALGSINPWISKTEHLLLPHGNFIIMKGKYPEEELNAIPNRFIVTHVARIHLEGIDQLRHLIVLSRNDSPKLI